jgi:hypothetical protein
MRTIHLARAEARPFDQLDAGVSVMTVIAGSEPAVSLYTYVQDAAASRKPGRSRLPIAVTSIAALAFTGLIAAAQVGGGLTPEAGPVRGEFRLAPGNQQPLGIVIPLDSQGAVPGEFRLGPGNATPPGVVVPLR